MYCIACGTFLEQFWEQDGRPVRGRALKKFLAADREVICLHCGEMAYVSHAA